MVFAEIAVVAIGRTDITEPIRKRLFIDLPRIFERIRILRGEDMRFQVSALFVVADILDTGEHSVRVINVESMGKEEAAFHPFERGTPADFFFRSEITSH